MRFKLRSTAAPYLTWSEGSGAAKVPTPAVSWIVLSFRDNQPPVVLGFPGDPCSLVVVGKPGAWEVRADDYKGWVRLGLPVGLTGEPANTAAALGRLATITANSSAFWTRPEPELLRFQATADDSTVTGEWTFDQPFVVIPQAMTMAPLAGYRVSVTSPHNRLKGDFGLGDGPHDVITTPTLKVQFPLHRVPLGRALVLNQATSPIGTISPFDIPSVSDLAVENLLAGRDTISRRSADEAVGSFLGQAPFTREPYTRQQLSFDATGNGLDLTAAHALLQQALLSTTKPQSDANALLTSVNWRRDWETLLPWVDNGDVRRRSAALAALAGALCPEPNRRLAGALFQAGLSGERGLALWRLREQQVPADPLLECAEPLRKSLFELGKAPTETDSIVRMLQSPFRVFSDEAIVAQASGSQLTMLEWSVVEPKGAIMTFAASQTFSLAPVDNLPRFALDRVLGLGEVRYTPESEGACRARLWFPTWGTPIPAAVTLPVYVEVKR